MQRIKWLLLTTGLFIFSLLWIQSCLESGPEFTESATIAPPNYPYTIEVTSPGGEFIVDAGECIELDVHVYDSNGNPADVFLQISTNMGQIFGLRTAVDDIGFYRFLYCAGCIPGGAILIISCDGYSWQQGIAIYGNEPTVIINRTTGDAAAAGYYNPVTFDVAFSCETEMLEEQIIFWSEVGCFENGCDATIPIDGQESVSALWFPPLRGSTAVNDETDTIYFPRSANIRATYAINGEPEEYDGSAVLYMYPLHARLYIDGNQDFQQQSMTIPPHHEAEVRTHIYWSTSSEDPDKYPVRGVPVTLSLNNSNGSTATLTNTTILTDENGLAEATLMTGTTEGTVTLEATIDVEGPGDCCFGEGPDSWLWQDEAVITITQ